MIDFINYLNDFGGLLKVFYIEILVNIVAVSIT